ncbi:MAG: hypothetical protein ACLFVQ_04375 [Chitinispirillaceae bacterium]
MKLLAALLVLGAISASFSQGSRGSSVQFDTIAGPLPSLVKAQKQPYLVISNIEVAPDKTVRIEPGAVFLFRNFTGLHVRGKLLALGKRDKPIVFTSENDRRYNPESKRAANPYDWDGVYLNADAIGTQFSFCKLEYSVYALNSETKFIRIKPMLFKDNGKEFVMIEGDEHSTTDNPFSYVLEKKDAVVDGVPVELLRDPLATKRNVTRYGSVALLAASLATGGYFGYEAYDSDRTYVKRSKEDMNNLQFGEKNEEERWKAKEERNRNYYYIGGSTLVSLISAFGFYWTFTF